MGIKDLIELGKNGHTLADIKELVELGKALEDEESKKADDTSKSGESGECNEELVQEIANLKSQLDESNALIKKLQDENIKNAKDGEVNDDLAEIGKLFI